jgi:hypothetical protein
MGIISITSHCACFLRENVNKSIYNSLSPFCWPKTSPKRSKSNSGRFIVNENDPISFYYINPFNCFSVRRFFKIAIKSFVLKLIAKFGEKEFLSTFYIAYIEWGAFCRPKVLLGPKGAFHNVWLDEFCRKSFGTK